MTLAKARERLMALPGLRLVQESPIYETAPWGDTDQPPFLNQVVRLVLGPDWSANRLLHALAAIELSLGRVRGKRRFGPRTIDLDILLYGTQRISQLDLIVPHPRLRERAFALVPLADIAAEAEIPDAQGGTVAQALAKIPFKIRGNSLETER